jgi:hypothetical protein
MCLENCGSGYSDVSVSETNMEMAEDVFWDVTACSLADALPTFQDKYCYMYTHC